MVVIEFFFAHCLWLNLWLSVMCDIYRNFVPGSIVQGCPRVPPSLMVRLPSCLPPSLYLATLFLQSRSTCPEITPIPLLHGTSSWQCASSTSQSSCLHCLLLREFANNALHCTGVSGWSRTAALFWFLLLHCSQSYQIARKQVLVG